MRKPKKEQWRLRKPGEPDEGFGPWKPPKEDKDNFNLVMAIFDYAKRSPYPEKAVFHAFRRVMDGELKEHEGNPEKLNEAFQGILKEEAAKLTAQD